MRDECCDSVSVEISPSYTEELKNTKKKDMVNNPSHYGGKDNVYEVIKVIRAWGIQNPYLGFNLLTALKYLGRAGLKNSLIEDLEKAVWYIQDEIKWLKENPEDSEGF